MQEMGGSRHQSGVATSLLLQTPQGWRVQVHGVVRLGEVFHMKTAIGYIGVIWGCNSRLPPKAVWKLEVESRVVGSSPLLEA